MSHTWSSISWLAEELPETLEKRSGSWLGWLPWTRASGSPRAADALCSAERGEPFRSTGPGTPAPDAPTVLSDSPRSHADATTGPSKMVQNRSIDNTAPEGPSRSTGAERASGAAVSSSAVSPTADDSVNSSGNKADMQSTAALSSPGGRMGVSAGASAGQPSRAADSTGSDAEAGTARAAAQRPAPSTPSQEAYSAATGMPARLSTCGVPIRHLQSAIVHMRPCDHGLRHWHSEGVRA